MSTQIVMLVFAAFPGSVTESLLLCALKDLLCSSCLTVTYIMLIRFFPCLVLYYIMTFFKHGIGNCILGRKFVQLETPCWYSNCSDRIVTMIFLIFWILDAIKGGLEIFMWIQRQHLQKVEKHLSTEGNGLKKKKFKDDNTCGKFQLIFLLLK